MVLEGILRSINSRRRSRGELIFASVRQHHALISGNIYFDSNMLQKGNATLLQRFPKESFAADVDRSKSLHAMSSNALFACTMLVTLFITNFHTVAFPMWENAMLESSLFLGSPIMLKFSPKEKQKMPFGLHLKRWQRKQISLCIDCLFEIHKIAVCFSLAVVARSLQGHWWGLNIYVVWPIYFL